MLEIKSDDERIHDISDRLVIDPRGGGVMYREFVRTLAKEMGSDTLNLLHGAVGVSGEAGELLDAVKKLWAYSKPMTDAVKTNIIEELGDIRFYCTLVMIVLDIKEEEVLEANAAKLGERYAGLVYSDEAAIARADKQETTSLDTSEGEAREPQIIAGIPQAINS